MPSSRRSHGLPPPPKEDRCRHPAVAPVISYFLQTIMDSRTCVHKRCLDLVFIKRVNFSEIGSMACYEWYVRIMNAWIMNNIRSPNCRLPTCST